MCLLTSTTQTDKINTAAQFKKTKQKGKAKYKKSKKCKTLILAFGQPIREREREFIRPGRAQPASQSERERERVLLRFES